MVIDPITVAMMLGSIGLNFITNSKNSKKQAELQERQKEFQRAQAEHDFQRMREAQERASQLNAEIEEELHAQRLEDIESSYDAIIDQIAEKKTIENWPITLLPFVMKGEHFGSFISSGIKSISMHCIFTPSNNKWFNDNLYKDIDYQVQAYINDKWHSHSTHPIIYHGGGWKNSNIIDLNQIDQLRASIKSVPTMVITPYFDVDTSLLFFRISIWGMGKIQEIKLHPQSDNSINRFFSYDYVDGKLPPENADTNDFINTSLEDLVPYIVSIIGYIADVYYWSFYGISPILPSIVSTGGYHPSICSFFTEQYRKKINDVISSPENQLNFEKTLSLIDGCVDFLSPDEEDDAILRAAKQSSLILPKTKGDQYSFETVLYTKKDLPYLKSIERRLSNNAAKMAIKSIIQDIEITRKYHLEYCATDSEVQFFIKSILKDLNALTFYARRIDNDAIIISPIIKTHSIDCKDCYIITAGEDSQIKTGRYDYLDTSFSMCAYGATTTTPIDDITINLHQLDAYKTRASEELNQMIELYKEIDSKTDIVAFINNQNIYACKKDIEEWINNHRCKEYDTISLYKAYSSTQGMYLLIGFFEKDGAQLTSAPVLISFYKHIPQDINTLFANTIEYKQTL